MELYGWENHRTKWANFQQAMFELCPFLVAGVGLRGHFEARIIFHLRGRHGTFCTFLKPWQA
jgi:hypothetical protein